MSYSPERAADVAHSIRLKKAAAAVCALAIACGGNSAAASHRAETHLKNSSLAHYDLQASYPNDARVRRGYYLNGTNNYDPLYNPNDPNSSNRSVLSFELLTGGRFRQYNIVPMDAKPHCHYDQLKWDSGGLGYEETVNQCSAVDNRIEFEPAIGFMPSKWSVGQQWEKTGVSQTSYFEAGKLVCRGLNRWRSTVVGEEVMPGGRRALHSQTVESQTLEAVVGAPASIACPIGQKVSFGWQENFYFGKAIPVLSSGDNISGSDTGMVRSMGGNLNYLQQTGHFEWDARFNSWRPISSS